MRSLSGLHCTSLNQVSTRTFSDKVYNGMWHVFSHTHINRNIVELLFQEGQQTCEMNKWRKCWYLGSLLIFIVTILAAMCLQWLVENLTNRISSIFAGMGEGIAPVTYKENGIGTYIWRMAEKGLKVSLLLQNPSLFLYTICYGSILHELPISQLHLKSLPRLIGPYIICDPSKPPSPG